MAWSRRVIRSISRFWAMSMAMPIPSWPNWSPRAQRAGHDIFLLPRIQTRNGSHRWMKAMQAPAIADYVNWRGRTVRHVREEANLHDVIENYLGDHAPALGGLPPREIHARLREFVEGGEVSGASKTDAGGADADRSGNQKSASPDRNAVAFVAAFRPADSRCSPVLSLSAATLGEDRSGTLLAGGPDISTG